MTTPLYQPLLVCTSVSCATNVINSPDTTAAKSPNLAGPSLTGNGAIPRIGRKTSQRPIELRAKWIPPVVLTVSDRCTVSDRQSQSRDSSGCREEVRRPRGPDDGSVSNYFPTYATRGRADSGPITANLDGRLRLRNDWSEIRRSRATSISLRNHKVRVLSRRS